MFETSCDRVTHALHAGNFFGVLLGSILSPLIVSNTSQIASLVRTHNFSNRAKFSLSFLSAIHKRCSGAAGQFTLLWNSVSRTANTLMQSHGACQTVISPSTEKGKSRKTKYTFHSVYCVAVSIEILCSSIYWLWYCYRLFQHAFNSSRTDDVPIWLRQCDGWLMSRLVYRCRQCRFDHVRILCRSNGKIGGNLKNVIRSQLRCLHSPCSSERVEIACLSETMFVWF